MVTIFFINKTNIILEVIQDLTAILDSLRLFNKWLN